MTRADVKTGSAAATERVHVCEVGPRDGLQNESVILSTADKIALIDGLVAAGVSQMEVGSFVHPKVVPAMADTDALSLAIKQRYTEKPRTLGLIMNEKGLERAIASGVGGVCIVTVVSETLCLKNNRCTADEATAMAVRLIKAAKAAGLYTRVDVATSWVCPYEGAIGLKQVQRHADQVWEYQPDELAFCDSIGYAQPFEVARLFEVFGERYERQRLVAHFHDTQALGLANATAALLQGIRRFDASIGGLGGCPFALGAKGNLATEDLVHLCHRLGLVTGIAVDKLWETVDFIGNKIARPLGGQSQAWFHSQRATTAQKAKER